MLRVCALQDCVLSWSGCRGPSALLSCQTGCDRRVLTASSLSRGTFIYTYSTSVCLYRRLRVLCHRVAGCAPRRSVFWAQVDIRLTDNGGDSSAAAYGNRLLTAKTWHQRKQVSQAWHSVLLRGLRQRLSAYGGIITPITSGVIPDRRGSAAAAKHAAVDSDQSRDKLHSQNVMDLSTYMLYERWGSLDPGLRNGDWWCQTWGFLSGGWADNVWGGA